jgi:mono/diheme cytochrome c family protein
MEKSATRGPSRVKRIVTSLLVAAAFCLGALVYPHCSEPGTASGAAPVVAGAAAQKDAEESRAAFLDVYKVLMHPRCMNCHPSGDAPLQGDDSHPHLQNVQRGEDGKGKYALKCANCHQDTNLPGENMPPGNPNWHLPKKDMPLVFQGKSPRELADQLKDPKRNGGKTLAQLLDHVEHDKLVLWGWQPGDGPTKPPLSHAEFAKKFREWVEKGAASPE